MLSVLYMMKKIVLFTLYLLNPDIVTVTNRALFFFSPKVLIFFLFLHEKICCGYSLEVPQRGASNEYHNICFRGEIRKILT